MLVVNKKPFIRGLFLLGSFFVVFALLLTPIFPDMEKPGTKLTGLQFADEVFNSLAKGSSDFSAMVEREIQSMQGKQVEITVPVKHPQMVPYATKVLEKSGMSVSAADNKLTYKGDIGPFLQAVAALSKQMYNNNGKAVESEYGVDKALGVTNACWDVLQPSIKELQKQGMIAEAKILDTVVRRAVEPAHNFYSVKATSVKDHVLLMSGLLIFYLLYTLWYGFGIFDFFEGIGLTMSKSKVKQEG